jgi:hypothetical protein
VRYHANQEQNDEDEKANSGDLSGSKSYNSKTEKTGDQGDYKEDQRIVEHGDSFLFSSSHPLWKATLLPTPKHPVFNAEYLTSKFFTRTCLPLSNRTGHDPERIGNTRPAELNFLRSKNFAPQIPPLASVGVSQSLLWDSHFENALWPMTSPSPLLRGRSTLPGKPQVVPALRPENSNPYVPLSQVLASDLDQFSSKRSAPE